MSAPTTTVVGVDLSVVAEDGQSDPLSVAVLELTTAAARVAVSPQELIAAHASLGALRRTVSGDLPELEGLLGRVLDLVDQVGRQVG